MKTFFKLALVTMVLAAGSAAQAQVITNTGNGTGTASDVVLFLSNGTSNFYTVDLGVTIDQIYSQAQVQADVTGGNTTGGSINLSASVISSMNAALTTAVQTWLTANAATGSWSVMAGRSTANAVGGNTLLVGTTASNAPASLSNALTATGAGSAGTTAFLGALNTALGSSGASTTDGWGATGGASTLEASAPNTFGANIINGGAIAGSLNLYFLAQNVAKGGNASIYTSAVIQLVNNAGTWSFSVVNPTAVPVPAAVWLLGSGLLGLAGVGRRRSLA